MKEFTFIVRGDWYSVVTQKGPTEHEAMRLLAEILRAELHEPETCEITPLRDQYTPNCSIAVLGATKEEIYVIIAPNQP